MSDPTTHYRALERMYLAAPINVRYPDVTIDVGEGSARIGYSATKADTHSAGGVHGSVTFKGLDDAAFFAANSLEGEFFVLTATYHVELLRAAGPGPLVAEGRVVKSGKTLIFAESTIRDAKGRELARGSCTFARGQTPLVEARGYAEG